MVGQPYGTHKTVDGTYKTVNGVSKTVNGIYKTVNGTYKTVKDYVLARERTCKRWVRRESRKGTCFCFAASAEMQLPSADSDLLMFCASLSRSPVAPVRDSRCESPNRLNLDRLIRPI